MQTRLPKIQSITQVYAVIAVMFSVWTITAFLWKLSAWLLLLNLGEIFTIFSYAMLANFIESLMVLLFLLAICALLPSHVLRDDFTVRGTILAMGIIGSLMAFAGLHMQLGMELGNLAWVGPIVVIALTALLWSFSSKKRFVSTSIVWLSDRLTVFLLILVPLFVILSAYVIFRNIA
jgi:hypothetical protein